MSDTDLDALVGLADDCFEVEMRMGPCEAYVAVWFTDYEGGRHCYAEQDGCDPRELPQLIAAAVAQARTPLTEDERAANSAVLENTFNPHPADMSTAHTLNSAVQP